MFAPDRAVVVAFSVLLSAATPSVAAQSIGKAIHIKTAVTGASGELAVDDPVFQDERIRTSQSGLGQFVFQDGTKLAVGWGSSVVIDKFVFDGSRSVKKLTVKAAKGTFRWISGNSKHAAYEILTPAGTIGVRGTVFDFYVGADGTTAMVLLGGSASFCGPGGCRELTRRCDCVVAERNGDLTETRQVDRSIFKTLGNTRALPFLSGSQKLSASGGGGCGLANVVAIPQDVAPKEKRAVPIKPDKKVEPKDPPDEDDKPEKPHDDKPDKPRDRDRHHNHHDRDGISVDDGSQHHGDHDDGYHRGRNKDRNDRGKNRK
ncbi:FecR domain-containing protein [Pararhizobium sp. LjRoot238]|uniref:FecR family protein n=1 Tax=Pararhizobium sp. LjRoot238 TaxID=3342293 RepID=UPI003ED02AC1